MSAVNDTRSSGDIINALLLGTNESSPTHHLVNLLNISDVSSRMAQVNFDTVALLMKLSSQENNTNVTSLLGGIRLFPPEWPAFVASVLLIFSLGNIFIAVGPIFSKELRKTRATILLSLLAVVDFLACLGAALENIYYSQHTYYKYQSQRRCFFIRIPYHIFAFWGPVILLLIGCERILLLKRPLFYKFHVRKRILFTFAMLSLVVPLGVLGIAYLVVLRQDKQVPICYNRFATQLYRTDIATIYYAHVYLLIAVVYLTFGIMMARQYRKIARRRSSGFAGFTGKLETSLGSDNTFSSSNNSSVKTVSDGKFESNVTTKRKSNAKSSEDNAKSLMNALMVITVIYVLAWLICIVALLASIGDTITTPKQLTLALYVSPLLYVNHGCNFFVFGWTSKLYLRAYKKTVAQCWNCLKFLGKQLICQREPSSR